MTKAGRYKPVRQLDQSEIDALKPVLKMREFCGIGGISMNTGQYLAKNGVIKNARKCGRCWRIPKAEALSYFGLTDSTAR